MSCELSKKFAVAAQLLYSKTSPERQTTMSKNAESKNITAADVVAEAEKANLLQEDATVPAQATNPDTEVVDEKKTDGCDQSEPKVSLFGKVKLFVQDHKAAISFGTVVATGLAALMFNKLSDKSTEDEAEETDTVEVTDSETPEA
jgi:hypothetical protein